MSSSDVLKVVDEIIARHPEMFQALEEYDKTRRLRKISHKVRVNFTIDYSLFQKFRQHCRENGFKMSTKMEKLMKKELESKI